MNRTLRIFARLFKLLLRPDWFYDPASLPGTPIV